MGYPEFTSSLHLLHPSIQSSSHHPFRPPNLSPSQHTHQPAPKSRHRRIPLGGKSPLLASEPRHLGPGPRIPAGPLSCPCMDSRMRQSPIPTPGARPPRSRDRSASPFGGPPAKGHPSGFPLPPCSGDTLATTPTPRNPTVQSPSSTPDGQLTTHFRPNHKPRCLSLRAAKSRPSPPSFFPFAFLPTWSCWLVPLGQPPGTGSVRLDFPHVACGTNASTPPE